MVPNSGVRFGLPAAIAIAVALLLALPAAAYAADTYADASAPDNSGDCLSAATACQTIGGVDGALSKSDPGDTTFVADGTYAESITLGDGKSLVSLDGTDPRPIIDNGSDPNPSITVASGGAGTVSGFRVRGDYQPIDLRGAATIEDNVFDESELTNSNAQLLAAAASIVVQDNEFTDPDATGPLAGIVAATAATPAPEISGNTFTDLGEGVIVALGSPEIAGNDFSGAHGISSFSFGDYPSSGVLVLGGEPTITQNTIGPAADIDYTAGVYISPLQGAPGPFPTGATLSRNRISSAHVGVQVVDSDRPVTLDNDLVHSTDFGLQAVDTSADTPTPSDQGDVSVSSSTLFDNGSDISLDHTVLTMDSSIVGTQINLVSGDESCAISYSRGPDTASQNGCDGFATNADPEFAGPFDYHLESTSPLIDVGDPADPGPGALDVFGDPRAVAGLPCSTERRDIGADEFNPPFPPGCADVTYADAATGSDGNDCLTPATACETINGAFFQSDPDATVFVAEGNYAESIVLADGKSLLSLDPLGPPPVIDNGAADEPAIEVASSGAGTVSGLTIRSECVPMLINGAVAVEGNTFDEEAAPECSGGQIDIQGGGPVVIDDNEFDDPNGAGLQVGIRITVLDEPGPVISNNTFTNLGAGVYGYGFPVVTGNQFSDLRTIGHTDLGDFPGAGVLMVGGDPTITQNTFGPAAEHSVVGVYLEAIAPSTVPTGATLRRNEFFGSDAGVLARDTNLPVTLSNDLIHDNTVGLESTDSSGDNPSPSDQGDVSATNATIYGNAVDLQISYTRATLDSTILGVPVDFVGDGACSISYSRGSSAGSANGCGNFVSTADPQFVNAASGDYRLQAGSPLIDIGNSASPGVGAVDFYGAAREIQGKACSSVRRDIGAAEYDPGTTPECVPPPAPAPDPAPETQDERPDPPRIDERPERRSGERTATFGFSSPSSAVSFRCRIDNKAWKSCEPPVTYRKLRYGKHRFRVQTVSPSGKRSRIKAVRFWVQRPE